MAFETFIARVLAHEGGYVNHKNDPGKATNYGITQAVARSHGYLGDMRNLSREKAIEIYRSDYWHAIRGEDLPAPVAWQVLDVAVNHGVRRAIQWLQIAAGAQPDGVIGAKTIAAVQKMPVIDMVLEINATRLQFYTDLNTWPTFGKGWSRRVAANLELAILDLKA